MNKLDVSVFIFFQARHQVSYLRVEVDGVWELFKGDIPIAKPETPVNDPAGRMELALVRILFSDPK